MFAIQGRKNNGATLCPLNVHWKNIGIVANVGHTAVMKASPTSTAASRKTDVSFNKKITSAVFKRHATMRLLVYVVMVSFAT